MFRHALMLLHNIFPQHKMHTGTFSFFARRPNITAMVFHNLLYDRQPYPAAALRRISGRVRAVKTFENIRQVFCRDPFSIIFYFYSDRVDLVKMRISIMPCTLSRYFTLFPIMLLITRFICSGSAITNVSELARLE